MRCADLARTWTDLCSWFDRNGVLVMPQLHADRPLVRLDGDVDPAATADPAELARVVERLRTLVRHFEVRAVYVQHTGGELAACAESGSRIRAEQAVVTIRVMAGGVVHELSLFAEWYAALLDRTVGMDFATTA